MFYSFEGPEGSGKTTLLNAVKEKLVNRDVPFLITREPGGTPVAEKIREVALSNELDLYTETLLMYAARNEHYVQKLGPALEKGMLVLTDRYMDSTAVYQFLLKGKTYSEFLLWQHFFQYEKRMPDMTFLLDIPVEETMRRLSVRGSENKFDRLSEQEHAKIRSAYLETALQNKERIVVLDGMQSIDVLTEQVVGRMVR